MLDLLTSLLFGWYYTLGWALSRIGILDEGKDPVEFVRKIVDHHPILHFFANVLLASTIVTSILFGLYLAIVQLLKAQKARKALRVQVAQGGQPRKPLLKPYAEKKTQ